MHPILIRHTTLQCLSKYSFIHSMRVFGMTTFQMFSKNKPYNYIYFISIEINEIYACTTEHWVGITLGTQLFSSSSSKSELYYSDLGANMNSVSFFPHFSLQSLPRENWFCKTNLPRGKIRDVFFVFTSNTRHNKNFL